MMMPHYLRNDEQNIILDATIGIETLHFDDNRQEMTHKLAMRIGALAKLSYYLSKFDEYLLNIK